MIERLPMKSTHKFIILVVAAIMLMATQPVAAFWPLDLFKGDSNSAQTKVTNTSTLLDRIIEKFGLNKSEVEQLVTDYRTERRIQMQAQYEERLNQAVTDGKITKEQKELILEKHNQLQSQWDYEKQQRQQHREEIQAWAEKNGIDLSYVGFGMGQGHGNRGGMMRGKGMDMVRGW